MHNSIQVLLQYHKRLRLIEGENTTHCCYNNNGALLIKKHNTKKIQKKKDKKDSKIHMNALSKIH